MTCGPGPGAGTRERNRFAARKAEHGGLECIGHTKQATTCEMCSTLVVNTETPEPTLVVNTETPEPTLVVNTETPEPEDATIATTATPITAATTRTAKVKVSIDTNKGARAPRPRYKREAEAETAAAESDKAAYGMTAAAAPGTTPPKPRPKCILPCPSKKHAVITLSSVINFANPTSSLSAPCVLSEWSQWTGRCRKCYKPRQKNSVSRSQKMRTRIVEEDGSPPCKRKDGTGRKSIIEIE